MGIEIQQPTGANEIKNQSLTITDDAMTLIISNSEEFVRAGTILTTIKALRKQIDEQFDPIIKKQHEAHRAAIALKKKFDMPLVSAENVIKPKLVQWAQAQERIRRAEEGRLREEARKAAEEARLADAVAAEQLGHSDEAERIIEQPIFVPAIVVKNEENPEGVSFRKIWKGKIYNENLIPREFLVPDEKKINAYIRAMGEKSKIPGVEVYCESSVAARGAA